MFDGDVSSSPPIVPPPRTVATLYINKEIYLPSLVELDSVIMLVGYKNMSCSCVWVLNLADLVLGRTVPATHIGDDVLFAGARGLCVSSNWLVMNTHATTPQNTPVASSITSLPVVIGDSSKHPHLFPIKCSL